MSIRTDVSIDWSRSPRIIFVDAPSAELVAQDCLDTCRDFEDKPENVDDDPLLDATGKQPLGGGVRVGITLELQDSIVAFQQRVTSDESGTATTADTNGTMLIDSAAQFQTNAIEPGATVINFTDKSVGTVIEVVSETELTLYALEDGTDNQWEIGDEYKIFNVDQCEITGGNFTAVDDVGAETSPIMPTAFTQVVRTSSSSATLQEQAELQYASFGGGVTVDVTSSYLGTTFPVGTPQQPVNNMTDALTIAAARGFGLFYIKGDITIGDVIDLEGYAFEGESVSLTKITIGTAAEVLNCEFYNAEVAGTLDGKCLLHECKTHDITYIRGIMDKCLLESGTIELGGGGEAHFLDCYSSLAGVDVPIIDFGGSGTALTAANYSGEITLTNKNGAETCSLDMASGKVTIDNTVTNGDIVVRGVGILIDNSNGANVIADDLLNPTNIKNAVWTDSRAQLLYNMEGGRWKIDSVTNQMIFYKADNTTEVARFNLFDSAGAPASENVYERRRVTTTSTTTTTTTSTSTTSTTTTP